MKKNQKDNLIRLIMSAGRPAHLEHGPAYDAVFNPFEFEGEEFYRFYDASIECWMIGRTVSPADRVLWPIPEEASDGDGPEEVIAANALSFMPTPRLPAVLDEQAFRGPFRHGSKQFFWLLSSLEEGWRLALSIGGSDNARVARLFDRSEAQPQPAA